MGNRSRVLPAAAALAMVAGIIIANPVSSEETQPVAPAQLITPTPLSFTITSVSCVDPCDGTGLEGPLSGEPDFYARVTVNGVTETTPRAPDDTASVEPFWNIAATIPAGQTTAPISVQIYDYDTVTSDDLADASPLANDNNLDLLVDLETGIWNGDVAYPAACAVGAGGDEPAVRVCWAVSVESASGDRDFDGLLDSWESQGLDMDGNGTVDVDLPAMGASSLHKDLFLELDYEAGLAPQRADVLAMKAAFAGAPLSNPDGTNGIRLWVDLGNLVDPGAREAQPYNTCRDGIDNGGDGRIDASDADCTAGRGWLDGNVEDPSGAPNCTDGLSNDSDGLADAADPNCRVGDDLGGGSVIPTLGACNLDGTWYDAKKVNFNSNRRWVFRYATSIALAASCPRSGGWGEIGGNDFMEFNHDGGTIMHELGHTLNLRHGGDENNNCKPNYVSVMNYDNQFGIGRVGGGRIIDYSPPRQSLDGTSHGVAPLPSLAEDDLDDGFVLDAGDSVNRYVFVDTAGAKVQATLSSGANWNSDVDPPLELDQRVNIDRNAIGGGPSACATNTSDDDRLEGFDDWKAISLPFRQFGDSADGAINPVTTLEPTYAELDAMNTALNTTDLALSLSDSADPVAAGTQFTYTARVTNRGPNPSSGTEVVHNLPAGTSFVSGSPGCTAASGTVTCQVGDLPAGTSRDVTVTVAVPADLVYLNGGPVTLSSTASVVNLNGTESASADNTDTETTRVIAVADLSVDDLSTTSPLEVLIGQPGTVSVDVDIANGGPSSPMDAELARSVTATNGATVTPGHATSTQTALAVDGDRRVQQSFSLACTAPGVATISFTYGLSPTRPDDVDPVAANNQRTASFQVDCVVPVAINIRPGGFPNSINLNTDATLALLTTRAGEYGLPLAFDAASVDVSTSRFGLRNRLFNQSAPTGAREIHDRMHLQNSYEPDDRSTDTDLDGVFHFKPADSRLAVGSTEGCLKGRFRSGGNTYTFLGCDSVRVVTR